MVKKTKNLHPPRGLSRLAYRLPIWIYRLGLGSLLGTRFMLLIHTGRKSGRQRRNVLEVIRYDRQGTTFLVAAGFGPGSDWYRNIHAKPKVTICCGRRRLEMLPTFITTEQAREELIDYAHRHPLATRALARFLGYPYDGSPEAIRGMADLMPMVAFHPEGGEYTGIPTQASR